MKKIVVPILTLAGLVSLLSVGIALTGLHRSSPMMAQAAFLLPAILINVVVIVLALRATRAESGYLPQLLRGAGIGVASGAAIALVSVLLMTVVLPNYLQEFKDSTIAWLEAQSLPEAVLQLQVEAVETTTATSQAMAGFYGTVGTSIVTAAIAGIFLRKRT